MPPKKNKGKGKGKAKDAKAPGGSDGPELTMEELLEERDRLKIELENERSERNFFQLERDKVNAFWDITKKQLEESRAAVRNKERELEEAEERHQVEIKVYKQKVKHLLYEHQNNITELKRDGVVSLTLEQNQHKEREKETITEKRELKVELKESELAHQEAVKALKLVHDQELTKIREEFEQLVSELQSKHDKKMAALRDELDLRRKMETHEVEERKNGQINALMKNHEKAFSDIKNYYNDITLNNLALINSLKEQVERMKKEQDRLEKQLSETQTENRKLQEPLQRAKEEVNELRKQLANYERDKTSLTNAKARVKALDSELKTLKWEHEVLEQRFAQIEKERDELYSRFVAAIHDIQQKSGFKNLLLEKKLTTLADTLEKKEAQLNEVLSASNLDPSALTMVTRKLEDVLDSKNTAIRDLQYELARVCKAHNDLIRTYEAKLAAFGVPTEELGFKPLQSTVAGQTLGQGPAGLVSSPP